uniref:Uncharacterized protein n=1 Tax=Setaria viridis TaxID=4556 RepID=A0A4U6UA60_SETVI|nr:uncharacterized protein LOC117860350 isoform X2 [Setaria viridis]TKW11234.1 hypothetical protein SEVIR_6G220200v2 [Setaria viridis]
MAGRFVIQKLASGMLRSAGSLSAHAPPASSATALGARYLSTFPGSREAAKTGWSKTGMQDSVGGVKPTCSSGACDKLQLADWLARVKAWWAHKETTRESCKFPSVVFIKSSHFLQHCLPPPWIMFCLLPIMWYRCSRLQGSYK